ncbi:MAG TPA: LytR C-terminal domain-containing protein [Baekduia sp.]
MTERHEDFFADLERQLVSATTDRSRRLKRARARRAATVSATVIAVLAVGGGLAAAVTSTGGDGRSGGTPAASVTTPTPTTATTIPPAPAHDAFETAVLNGTTVPGLARGVATRLQNARFKIGTVTNAAAQTHASTAVYYVPGARDAAAAVARSIDVPENRLALASRGVTEIAGAQAHVIVVVGDDQNISPRHKAH